MNRKEKEKTAKIIKRFGIYEISFLFASVISLFFNINFAIFCVILAFYYSFLRKKNEEKYGR